MDILLVCVNNSMKKIQDIYDFVDRAIKSRKYPENTGMALKTALKLFDAELNDEERNSVEEFRKNIDQIYQSVFSKNKNFSAGSLATYKSRVLKALSDFEKYGIDPTKMAGWSPKVISRPKKQNTLTENIKSTQNTGAFSTDAGNSVHVFDFTGGVKLLIPKTIKATEAIMDGELKQIKIELKKFSDTYCEEVILSDSNNQE